MTSSACVRVHKAPHCSIRHVIPIVNMSSTEAAAKWRQGSLSGYYIRHATIQNIFSNMQKCAAAQQNTMHEDLNDTNDRGSRITFTSNGMWFGMTA